MDVINTAVKWQEKVAAFQTFLQFVKANNSIASEYAEAIASYCLIFTNNCTASNVNILRSGLECLTYIISTIGVGPRCCSVFIPCLLNKVEICVVLNVDSGEVRFKGRFFVFFSHVREDRTGCSS